MKHGDFSIGTRFGTASGEWLCTDVGTRTVTAIKLEAGKDDSWLQGPPYAVQETVFDEGDFEGCAPASSRRERAGHAD